MEKLRLKHTEGPGGDNTERVVELKEAVQVLKGLSRASIRSDDQEKESNVISTKLGTALWKDLVQSQRSGSFKRYALQNGCSSWLRSE